MAQVARKAGLAAVHRTAVTVSEARIAADAADSAAASCSTVRRIADRAARVAVPGVAAGVDLAARDRVAVAVGETSVAALDAARSADAGSGRVRRATGSVAHPAVCVAGVQIGFAEVDQVRIALAQSGRTRILGTRSVVAEHRHRRRAARCTATAVVRIASSGRLHNRCRASSRSRRSPCCTCRSSKRRSASCGRICERARRAVGCGAASRGVVVWNAFGAATLLTGRTAAIGCVRTCIDPGVSAEPKRLPYPRRSRRRRNPKLLPWLRRLGRLPRSPPAQPGR